MRLNLPDRETMQLSGVRPSVCLSVPSFACRTPLLRFAAERQADRRHRSIAARCSAVAERGMQMRAVPR